VNGYAEVLSYNGKIDFVPSSQIRPYHSDLKPNGGPALGRIPHLSTLGSRLCQTLRIGAAIIVRHNV